MNLIAQEAGVTKLTVYNHFQDKANLFICAITETCEETLGTKPFELDASADFYQTLYMVCSRALQIIYSPKHLNSSMYYLNLQQSKVHSPYSFDASHTRLQNQLVEFFKSCSIRFYSGR